MSSYAKPFFTYLRGKPQRLELIVWGIFYVIAYFLIIYSYPFPDGISDSGAYVSSALHHSYDGYRPYGYSQFLILIHSFSTSFRLVVFVQFLLNALGTLFFVFTVRYFFQSCNVWISRIFTFVAVFSLISLYLADTILSDSLFTTLTLFWLAFGLWFLYEKRTGYKVLFSLIQIILLISLVRIRYTGLFYTGIQILLFIAEFYKKKQWIGAGLLVVLSLLLLDVYQKQVEATKRVTGIEVFSGFSGWQMANNALHVLPYVEPDIKKIPDSQVREFMQIAKNADSTLILDGFSTSAKFLWDNNLLLKRYLFYQMKKRNWIYLKTWTFLGKNVYGKFGSYMLKKYPLQYTRYFFLPNLWGILYPTGDQVFLSFKTDAIPAKLLNSWFGVPSDVKVSSRGDWIGKVSPFLPKLRLIIWILFFFSVLWFFIKRKYLVFSEKELKMWVFLTLFVFAYLAFHVYASPFEVRYIAPIHVPQVAIIYLSFFAHKTYDK